MTTRDSIEELHVDLDAVRDKFERSGAVHNCCSDFDDRIDHGGKGFKTYGKQPLTVRIDLLKQELDELISEIDETNDEKAQSEKDQLIRLFEEAQTKVKQRGKIVLSSLDAVQPEVNESHKNAAVDSSSLVRLEDRISQLEGLIGKTDDSSSLQQQINQLQRHLQLLSNDSMLQQIMGTVEQVNKRFEQSIALRRNVEMEIEIQEDVKIHELYELVIATKDIQHQLPLLIDRLESLNELHFKTATAVSTVDEMDDKLMTLSKDLDNWEHCLSQLESKFQSI